MAKASKSKRKQIIEAKSTFSRRSKRLKGSEKSSESASKGSEKSSESASKKYKPRLLMEREVQFTSIDDTFLNLFDRQGWGIMYREFSTPKMHWVQQFYENFCNRNEDSAETTVEGVTIHLTPAVISGILKIPLLSEVSSKESYITRNGDNRDEVMRFFTSDPLCQWPKKATTFNANKFVNPIHRLGMNIMNANLYPTANRHIVTLGRMLFLYDMFNNRPIDLPHHLFHVMCHASVKSGVQSDVPLVLPFPSLVTKLLSHKDFNIPEPEYFEAPKRQRPISRFSLEYSISHLHQPAPDLERPASPNHIDPFPENDATTTSQSPPTESVLQSLRAFHDEMRQDMRVFHDEMRAFRDEMRKDMLVFQDEMRQRISSIETRLTSQSVKCTRCAEMDFGAEDDAGGGDYAAEGAAMDFGAEDDAEGGDYAAEGEAMDFGAEVDAEGGDYAGDYAAEDDFWDDTPQHFNSMETGTADHTADDTVTASRHNLLDNMGDPPCPSSYQKKLLILDVNGLLLALHPKDTIKTFDTAIWRPFYDKFLCFCFEKFDVAVWSSRSRNNLDKLIKPLTLTDKNLIFCWDQSHCTKSGRNTLDCPSKPLFLKDLRKVWEKYVAYNATNTLLLDDSPYKALLNPPNTAVFPETFQYGDDNDNSLGPEGDLRKYLEKLAMAENVQKYVEQNPFGQRAITESDPNWKYYSDIIKAWS